MKQSSTVPNSQSTYKEYLDHTFGLTLSTPSLVYNRSTIFQDEESQDPEDVEEPNYNIEFDIELETRRGTMIDGFNIFDCD